MWAFHETFNPDKAWVAETQAKYRAGQIGDVDCKKKLVDVLVALIEPIRKRRVELEGDPVAVMQVLKAGTERALAQSEETLVLAKKAIRQDYFGRSIALR
jgi:tryptophanyl-tRNA synthetase